MRVVASSDLDSRVAGFITIFIFVAMVLRSSGNDLSALNPAQVASAQKQLDASDAGIKRFSYFIGSWNMEGSMKATQLGPAGKMLGTHRYEWAPDNQTVILHWNEQRPTGSDTGEGRYQYDSSSKVYIYNGMTNSGEKETSTGTISGDTWTWISTLLLPDGQASKGRFQITQLSATSYSFEFDIASQNGEWTTVMVGQAVKSK